MSGNLSCALRNAQELTFGYTESSAYCHLCGVSFNIARHRKPGEPRIATYNSTDGVPAEIEDIELEECVNKGCTFVIEDHEGADDLVKDPDYQPGKEEDDEPYEYDSNYDSDDAMSLSEDEDAGEAIIDDEEMYNDFLSRTIHQHHSSSGEPVGAFAYLSKIKQKDFLIPITSDELPEGYEPEELEHIPGPTCPQAQAYAGAAISLVEMRGCRSAQFLVHKSSAKGEWQPDGLNEDWEMTEDWFLSGVCDGMTSRDCGFPTVQPARGGVKDVYADNVNFDPHHISPTELGMPFHPWCFDIFSRQSKSQFGRVNVNGLMKWRDAESSYKAFHEFPRIADVLEAQEQWWEHVPGKEYLAANPLYVPGLPALLLDAAKEEGIMGYGKEPAPSSARGAGHLGSLPLDLRLHIISFLGSDAIASLRAASTAFTHLPNSVWYRLVREDMPWLWEAWDEGEIEHTPSFWTMMTANDVKYMEDVRKHYLEVLKDEHPGVDGIIDYLLPRPSVAADLVKLHKANTNWYQVYIQIKSNWNRLKGLRNRQRIWEDVEEVIRRIRKYEEQSF
ncbi:hypothetical protein BJX63DRAFT_420009 [Aspergillus granulosus]|uniref:F-box domain-containing protein n=1 Tax=Aspergillus granulosus TaxID=176169 RepID=A0ABR4HMC1_9EURO